MEALKIFNVDEMDNGLIYSDVKSIDDSAVDEELDDIWYDDNDMVDGIKGERSVMKILENY